MTTERRLSVVSSQDMNASMSSPSSRQIAASEATIFVRFVETSNVEDKLSVLESIVELLGDSPETILQEPQSFQLFIESLGKHLKSLQTKVAVQLTGFVPSLLSTLLQLKGCPTFYVKDVIHLSIPILIERTGDARDKIRDAALDALVQMYKLMINAGGAALTSGALLSLIDKEIKVNGFGNKNLRVRLQMSRWFDACMTIPNFAWKAYIPYVIKLLEDTQESVRSAAMQAISTHCIGLNKAFKQEMKKELVKLIGKVPKVDQILTILSDVVPETLPSHTLRKTSSNASINNANSKTAGGTCAPPPTPLIFETAKELEIEMDVFLSNFKEKETDQNWEARELALQKLRSICRGNAQNMDEFVGRLKDVHEQLIKSMHSLRTALVVTTCSTIVDLSEFLGMKLDPFAEPLFVNLIKVAGQTKKIASFSAMSALASLLKNISYNPRHLNYMLASLSEKGLNLRINAMNCIRCIIELAKTASNRDAIECSGIDVLEMCIKKGLVDASAEVRDRAGESFEVYEAIWPDKAMSLMDNMDMAARKLLLRRKSNPGSSLAKSSKDNLQNTLDSSRKISQKNSKQSLKDSIKVNRKSLTRQSSASGITNTLVSPLNKNEHPEEDEILDKLKSSDGSKQMEGLKKLNQAIADGQLSTCGRIYLADKLGSAISAIISKRQSDAIEFFTQPAFLGFLIEQKLLSLNSVLSNLCLILIDSTYDKEAVLSQRAAACIDELKTTVKRTVLLESFVTVLNEFRNSNNGGFAAARERERIWQELLLGLINQQMAHTDIGSEDDNELTEFFADGTKIRHLLLRMIPILERKTLLHSLEELIYTLLARLYHYNSPDFVKTLNTFDEAIVSKLSSKLNIDPKFFVAPLPTLPEKVTTQVHPSMAAVDSIVEESSYEPNADTEILRQSSDFNSEEPNMLDETIPEDFAEMSTMQIMDDGDAQAETIKSNQGVNLLDFISDWEPAASVKNKASRLNGSDGPSGMVGHVTPTKNEPLDQLSYTASTLNRLKGMEKFVTTPKSIMTGSRFMDADPAGKIFVNATPSISQAKRSDYLSLIPTCLESLRTSNVDTPSIRRLIRISRDTTLAHDRPDDYGSDPQFSRRLWDIWFEETLDLILNFLRDLNQSKDQQETCLILLTELIQNQTLMISGREKDILGILLECRSDGSNEVSGGSERALKALIRALDPEKCIITILNFLLDQDLDRNSLLHPPELRGHDLSSMVMGAQEAFRKNRQGQSFSRVLLSSRPASYQPIPSRSAFEALGLAIERFAPTTDILTAKFSRAILDVCQKGINSVIIDNRRGAVMALVAFAQVIGEDKTWSYLGGRLSSSQEKLVAVYMERGKKASINSLQ